MIAVLGDGVLKRLVHFPQPVLENFAEADQDRQRDAAELQIVDQFLEIEAAIRVLVGVDPKMSVRAHRKIAFAPTGDVVEFGGFGGGPAVGRLANRGAVCNSHGSHEFSVSFDLTRRASRK